MSNPWYAHYPGDYGRDTAHLSLVQHGAYRLLLDHYYATAAALPLEPSALYRICRAFDESERKAVDAVTAEFFDREADGYHNGHADMELVKRAEQHARLSNGAKKAMRNRWGTDKQASKQAIARPQPQPQPQKERIKPSASDSLPESPLFEQFWAEFPKKVDKLAAMRAWRKVKPDEVPALLARLELNKFSEWAGKEKRYIPNPASWLNGRRWTDEILAGGSNGKPSIGDNAAITLASHVEQERLN